MKSRKVHEYSGQRTFVLVFDSGDPVMSSLQDFSRAEGLFGAQITGIGAFREATLRYFDLELKDYLDLPVARQAEVASLVGDIGVDPDGGPAIHIHLVLGLRDGSALAGHLKEAVVRPTLELTVVESPAHLCRRKDPETGLNLIRL